MQEKFPLQCLFLIRVCSRDYVVFRTENIRSKKDAKKAELRETCIKAGAFRKAFVLDVRRKEM